MQHHSTGIYILNTMFLYHGQATSDPPHSQGLPFPTAGVMIIKSLRNSAILTTTMLPPATHSRRRFSITQPLSSSKRRSDISLRITTTPMIAVLSNLSASYLQTSRTTVLRSSSSNAASILRAIITLGRIRLTL